MTEVQPERAQATVPYRVHLIITYRGLRNPVSYRVKVQARSFDTAWGAALADLRRTAVRKGMEDVTVLSYGSCERVPEGEAGA